MLPVYKSAATRRGRNRELSVKETAKLTLPRRFISSSKLGSVGPLVLLPSLIFCV